MNDLVGVEIRVQRCLGDEDWMCLVMKKDAEQGKCWVLMPDSSWREYGPYDELDRLPLKFLKRTRLRRMMRRFGFPLRGGCSPMLWGSWLRRKRTEADSALGLE